MKKLVIILILLPIATKEMDVSRDNRFDSYLYAGLGRFKAIMAFRESSNNPDTTSSNGHYRGLYQFGISASKDVDVHYDSLFIPRWSDTALVRYMRLNWKRLGIYQKYVGDTISGIVVTKAGLLAASHLKGCAWVKEWLRTNGETNASDLNGTTIKDYMKLMEKVELIKY